VSPSALLTSEPDDPDRALIERASPVLIDRSLGRKHLAKALKDHGMEVHTLASVWGEEGAQALPDEDWLGRAGREGWIVFMKDDRIRRRPTERDALIEAGVRAFCLTNANLRASEQTQRFVSNLPRILRRAEEDSGPYIDGIYEGRVDRLFPR
jgi:hypothetical protein